MWVIAFFSVLLVAIVIYAVLQKKSGRRDFDTNEFSDEDETINRL